MRVMRDVVLCKDCALRGTGGCPMVESCLRMDEDGAEVKFVDKTTDCGFCHMGAQKEQYT